MKIKMDPMEFRLLPEITKQTERSIFITGGTRTGTTLMGRLIYSLERVECFHEPAFLYAFFYMINDLGEEQWKLLLESFVYEELLLSALAGRRLNFNENDDSCVFHSRPREEIAERLTRTHRHHELIPRAKNYRLAFKMPETLPQLDHLRRYYPEMTFLVMLRRPEPVIASLMERGWYSDHQLINTGGDWIFRRTSETTTKIAPWVPDHMITEFLQAPEADRCAMCYIEQYRYLVGRKDCVIVDYERLLEQPFAYFRAVVERLGERFGPLTIRLLDSIGERSKDRMIPLQQIAPERRRRMSEIYEECRTKAVVAHELA